MLNLRIIPRLKKAIDHPSKAYNYIVWKIKEKLFWNSYYKSIREPKIKSSIPVVDNEAIVKKLLKNHIKIVDYVIDVDQYNKFIADANYHKMQSYYGVGGKENVFKEKTLEHYLAAELLKINSNDVYIDVANAFSPVPEIYNSLFKCEVYSQDLIFDDGLHGRKIGGDAGNMPVNDGFATKMALHCSFEHFEKEADTRFIKEASRVLNKGGKLCILPLYLSEKYLILSDPSVVPKDENPFEDDVTIHCVKSYGNRHGRFYDVANFINRVVNHLNDLQLTMYVIQNENDVDESCYVKFVPIFEKI